MPFTIDYSLTGTGWAECIISSKDYKCEISASYLSDALGSLVVSAIAILSGAQTISIGFDEEPGEYRWCIKLIDADKIQLTILGFTQLWGLLPDSEGDQLFSTELTTIEFGIAIRDAAQNIFNKHGVVGYKERWSAHDFPSEQLSLLNHLIAL
ncbi:hypothetical protein [Chitinibacter sp. GC72]|uniref:hypothetical protein n=1 Tax=Chitinibacter sp. GC72 TaxID=1526917 RepID=UPI0012F8B930|nr:hypothetical protein [Chitinibacter sp. GC72]